MIHAAIALVVAVSLWLLGDREVPVTEVASDHEDHSASVPTLGPTSGESATDSPQTADVPLWHTINEASVNKLPYFAPEWSTQDRVLVRVSETIAAARTWRAGDRLTIPVPQLGETYHPKIDEIDDGPGYSRAALGKILGADGWPRRFVVTVGPTSMFAFIDTPQGTYELMAGSEYGWLLPTSSMTVGFDFSEPDYILPTEDSVAQLSAGSGPDNPD